MEQDNEYCINSAKFTRQIRVFFIRKKLIRKRGSTRQNLKKLVRKAQGSTSKIKCFHRPKINILSLLRSSLFKMLKKEFKFKYTISITKV